MDSAQFERMGTGHGFIAALDQSGGSTPGALKRYGIEQQAEIVRHAFLLRAGVAVAGAPDLATYETILPFLRP